MKALFKTGLAMLALSGFFMGGAEAQETPLDGIYKMEHVKQSKVTPYSSLREADVLWMRRIWRVIDVREKMNLPFNWPKNRLIDVIYDGVLKGDLTAYNADTDDEFKVPLTAEEVASLGRVTEELEVQDPNTGQMVRQSVTTDFNRASVYKYRLKEEWFFDRQRSIFECRIIGIAPVYPLYSSEGVYIGDKALFWIYFDEARQTFSNAEYFNRFNDGQRLSYDDIFIKRFFSSYITKEANEYDRRIQDYKQGLDALNEAEDVKAKLFEFEHDLWEY